MLEHTICPPKLPTDEQRSIMQALADRSALAFQKEVYQSENGKFSSYFHAATPTSALASMNLGSRPAKRKAAGGIETLRAIPWVFAWTQTRLHLPVWLGGGAALAERIQGGGLPELQHMYQTWPFFQGMIDLVELELSKAEPSVSSYYDAKLCTPELKAVGDALRAALAEAIGSITAVRRSALPSALAPPILPSHDLPRSQFHPTALATDPCARPEHPPTPPPCPDRGPLLLGWAHRPQRRMLPARSPAMAVEPVRGCPRAMCMCMQVSSHASLLENHPHTKQSFALRRPYLLALHAIQGEVMARLKTAPDDDAARALSDAMTVTVQGIAAGMQNTG